MELERRFTLWKELKLHGGPNQVAPGVVKGLRLHRGQQGVFRDQELTAPLTPSGAGIAVGLLHTGSSYADDLSEDGVIYHYPKTGRGMRDRNEIQAIKACMEHSLPIFVIVTPQERSSTRNVRLGWVTDYDDASGSILILFSEVPVGSGISRETSDGDAFELIVPRTRRAVMTRIRTGQILFRFLAMKRYGSTCAFCKITEPQLLEAAHLCPVEANGTDDTRNALVMCLTHHRAFDVGLLLVDPDSLRVQSEGKSDLSAIGVTFLSLEHLQAKPHREALSWVWSHRSRKPCVT